MGATANFWDATVVLADGPGGFDVLPHIDMEVIDRELDGQTVCPPFPGTRACHEPAECLGATIGRVGLEIEVIGSSVLAPIFFPAVHARRST